MKTSVVLVLASLTFAVAGCSDRSARQDTAYEPSAHTAPPTDGSSTLLDDAGRSLRETGSQLKTAGGKARDAASGKLDEWNFTAADIKANLEKGGRFVYRKAAVAGEKIAETTDNARIVTVVNARLAADANLSAIRINVDADKGVVTLTGSVDTPELVARAVGITLATEGVSEVIYLLKVG